MSLTLKLKKKRKYLNEPIQMEKSMYASFARKI